MAKSLRSKPRMRAKTIKRNTEFGKHDDERKKRLAAKLAEKDQQEKTMDTDDEPKVEKKISTGGWRDLRSQIYKKTKAKKGKKNKTMRF